MQCSIQKYYSILYILSLCHLQVDALEQQLDIDKATQEDIFNAALAVRDKVFKQVSGNIKKEQAVQKAYYDKKHETGEALKVGTQVMQRNMEHSGRKGGKMDYQFYGPYTDCEVDEDKGRYSTYTLFMLNIYICV